MSETTCGWCVRSLAGWIAMGLLLGLPAVVSGQTPHDCNDPFNSGILANCGFEDSTPFNFWIVIDNPAPLWPWTISPAGPPPLDNRFFPITPTEGMVAALHGFDGNAGVSRVAQDLTVLGIGISTVEFDFRAAWDLVPYGATLPRHFEVNVEPFGGGSPMQSTVILTAQPGTLVVDTGPLTAEVDLKLFGGGIFRLSFDFIIPENYTGPATFQLDNIQIHPPEQLTGGELVGSTGQALNQLIGIDKRSVSSWLRHQLGQFDMVTDIDFRGDGVLFAATGNNSANIVSIDPQSGQESLVGNFGSGLVMGLEFIGGVLYGTYETLPTATASDLVIIDQSTGALTTIGSTGFQLVEGLAYDRRNGVLYGVTSGAAGGDLITIDMATGAGTLVGATGFTHVAALEFHPLGLFAGIDMGAGADAGKLITLDPSTGAGSVIGQTRWAGLNGLSFFPNIFDDDFETGDTSAWSGAVP